MARESVATKAARYLTEARLTLDRVDVDGGWIVARCRGDGGEYALGFDPSVKQYRCTCPAKGDCAHLHALRLVVIR